MLSKSPVGFNRYPSLLSLALLAVLLLLGGVTNSFAQQSRGIGDSLLVASEGVSLQDIIDSLGYDIDVDTDELGVNEISSVQYGYILAELVAEYTGAAEVHEFGLVGPSDEPGQTLVFSGSAVVGGFAQVEATLDSSGVYRNGFYERPNLPQLPQTWYSDPSRNSDGLDHLKVFDLGEDGYLLGWEDLPNGGDGDYQDVVVRVKFTSENQPPVVSRDGFDPVPVDTQLVLVGESLTYDLLATDVDGPKLILAAFDMPAGSAYTPSSNASGTFTFAPTLDQVGEDILVVFTAWDGLVESNHLLRLIVDDINVAPQFDEEPSNVNLRENDEYVLDLSASDNNGDALNIVAENIPTNAEFEDLGDGHSQFSLIADYHNVIDEFYHPTFVVSDGELADTVEFLLNILNLPLAVGQTGIQADILVDSAYQLTFNEVIDVQTLNASVTAISRSAGTQLRIQHDVINGVSVVKIRPTLGSFRDIDTVEIHVSRGLLDLAGYNLQDEYSATFTTGATVFPGDTDRNGVVDERDILPIGANFGQTGPARAVVGIDWNRHATHVKTNLGAWSRPLAVYADADGSGEVDIDDVCAVVENFGQTHGPVPLELRNGSTSLVAGTIDPSVAAQIQAALDNCAPSPAGSPVRDLIEEAAGIDNKALPTELALKQNYPNPFNPTTVISFDLPAASEVSLIIYNISGQKVKTLANGQYAAGTTELVWDATDEGGQRVASGMYLYRLIVSDQTLTRRMLLVK